MANTADILRSWADETERVTRKQLADCLGCSISTVSRLIADEAKLTMEQYLSLAACPDAPLAMVLDVSRSLHRRTRVAVGEVPDRPDRTVLDANGDGIVDAKDTVAHALGVISKAADAASALKSAICAGKTNVSEQATAVVALREAEQVIRFALATIDGEPCGNGRGR